MLPDSAYPGPLPLDREAGLALLAHLDDFDSAFSTFLTFVMIPVEPRRGEWRYAGASRSLADAVRQVGRFASAMGDNPNDGTALLRDLLEAEEGEEGWHFPPTAPVEGLGPNRLVLCVQSDAPYDDVGACIVEVAPAEDAAGDCTDAALANWRKTAVARLLEAGTRHWGSPPANVLETLEQRSDPDDWVRWFESEWGEELDGWEDVCQPRRD